MVRQVEGESINLVEKGDCRYTNLTPVTCSVLTLWFGDLWP